MENDPIKKLAHEILSSEDQDHLKRFLNELSEIIPSLRKQEKLEYVIEAKKRLNSLHRKIHHEIKEQFTPQGIKYDTDLAPSADALENLKKRYELTSEMTQKRYDEEKKGMLEEFLNSIIEEKALIINLKAGKGRKKDNSKMQYEQIKTEVAPKSRKRTKAYSKEELTAAFRAYIAQPGKPDLIQSKIAQFTKIPQPTWSRAFNNYRMLSLFKNELEKFEEDSVKYSRYMDEIEAWIQKVPKHKEKSLNKKLNPEMKTDFLHILPDVDMIPEKIDDKIDLKKKIERMKKPELISLLKSNEYGYDDDSLREYSTLEKLRELALLLIET
jgi:hypothetical protein